MKNNVFTVARWTFIEKVRNPAFRVLFLISIVCTAIAAKGNSVAYSALVHKLSIVFLIVLGPIYCGAAILASDLTTGRIFLIMATGVSRASHLLGKMIGTTLAIALSTLPALTLTMLFDFGNSSFKFLTLSWVIVSLFLVLAQSVAVLTLLSTFLRGWANSITVIVLSVIASILYVRDHYQKGSSWNLSEAQARAYKLVLISPYPMAVWTAMFGAIKKSDLVSWFLTCSLCTLLAVVIYRRKQFGLIASAE